jgi:large subunit ribosomal protein L15
VATQTSEEKATRAGRPLRLHHLRPAPGAHKARTRVGRGEGGHRGKTAGRGTKGSKARDQIPTNLEGGALPMHMRIPKIRGFKNRFKVEYQVVNLDRLARLYPEGGQVTVEDLAAKGAVRAGRPVKVLGDGEATAAWQVAAHAFSRSAVEKITAAGGSVTKL